MLPDLTTPRLGACPCGGAFEVRWVDIRLDSGRIFLPGMPQGACPRCGSRVYGTETLLRLEGLYQATRKPHDHA